MDTSTNAGCATLLDIGGICTAVGEDKAEANAVFLRWVISKQEGMSLSGHVRDVTSDSPSP